MTDANLSNLPLPVTAIPLPEFGCFVKLDGGVLYDAPMLTSGHMAHSENPEDDWNYITHPEEPFLKAVNQLFGSDFTMNHSQFEHNCGPSAGIIQGYHNVYKTEQCYGGPEEGGWWYQRGTLLEAVPTRTVDDCNSAWAEERKAIQERYLAATSREYRMGNGPHDGADPDGEGDDAYLQLGGAWGVSEIRVITSNKKGKSYPAERPHYC